MRRFERILPWVLCIALLVSSLTLTGCHGNRGLEPFAMPESFDTSKQYQITFWAKNDTNLTQTKIYKKAIEDFQKLYPNISVKLQLYTDYAKIYNDVITNIATQTTPNVCITYPDHIATYLSGVNVVVPLDGLLQDSRYGLGGSELRFDSPAPGEMITEYLEEGKIGGVSYAIPFMRSTEACYINKTLVEKLGYEVPEVLTWDFMFEVAEAAAVKDADGTYPVNGQKVMIPIIYKSTDNMMIQRLYQKGADYTTEEGEILFRNDAAEEIIYEVAEHAATGAFSTFKVSSYPGNFLNAGQCIFGIDSTAGATWMGPDSPNSDIAEEKKTDFELVVRPVPQEDTENISMISQGPSVCIFNKADPGEVLASWLFASYLLTNEVQLAYSETEGYVPVTKKAQEAPEYREYLSLKGTDEEHYAAKIEAAEMLMSYTDRTFTTPVFRGSASVRDAAGQLIDDTVKAVRRSETVDGAYMDALFDNMTSLYRLDQLGADSGSEAERQDLGALPAASKWLICGLIAVWAGIAAVFFGRKLRKVK